MRVPIVAFSFCLLLLNSPCLAQVPGDADSDGDVDATDFAAFSSCVSGPAAAVSTGCAPFDMNGDGRVDAFDGVVLQEVATGPAGTCAGVSRKYVIALKDVDSLTGVSAKITTRSTVLCGEPTSNQTAGSLVWIGVTQFVSAPTGATADRWAQIGYMRRRSESGTLSTTVAFSTFYEIKSAPGLVSATNYKRVFGSAPLSGDREYKCWLLLPNLGRWRFEFDGDSFDETLGTGWANQKGSRADYTAEILNSQDQMAGVLASKCSFTECKWQINSGDFVPSELTAADLRSDDAAQWQFEFVNPTSFRVWDVVP